MSNIEKKVLKVMSQRDTLFPNDDQLKSFEEALVMFNDLVKRGLLKPRGYTLQTIEDSMKPDAFNVSVFGE